MITNGLTEKMRLFCLHYLGDAKFNASEAARMAGYSAKTAYSIGQENMNKPVIQEYLSELVKRAEDKAEINIADIVKHLHDMAFFDAKDIMGEDGGILPLSKWPPIASKVIGGFETTTTKEGSRITKVKFPSRERNTENLGRYLAMFTDKIKDVSDPTEMIHIHIPAFNESDDGDEPWLT